jgi:hypothetical protein
MSVLRRIGRGAWWAAWNVVGYALVVAFAVAAAWLMMFAADALAASTPERVIAERAQRWTLTQDACDRDTCQAWAHCTPADRAGNAWRCRGHAEIRRDGMLLQQGSWDYEVVKARRGATLAWWCRRPWTAGWKARWCGDR